MIPPKEILKQIQNTTRVLIELSLCDQHNQASMKENGGGITSIEHSNLSGLSFSLKNEPYRKLYSEMSDRQSYNFRMLDGALIQLLYIYRSDVLKQHRLIFFPSPDLIEFQNDPELYLDDEIYADVILKSIVPTPIRFDYDADNAIPLEHPASHLTIGQYKNCRVPVYAPLTAYQFIDFILRNFYHTAHKKYADALEFDLKAFTATIADVEKKHLYIGYQ